MIWHDHVGMDAYVFVIITKSQAVVDDLYWFGIDENRQPINNGGDDKVNVNTLNEFVALHKIFIYEKLLSDQDTGDLAVNYLARSGDRREQRET